MVMGMVPGGRHYSTRPEGRQSYRRGGCKKKTLELPAQAIRGIFFGPLIRTVITVRLLALAGDMRRGLIADHPYHVEE
jgi:hypothetical protein